MKKFRFRLAPVLKYRNRIKNEKKQELANANARLQEQEQQLERLLQAQLENTVSQNASDERLIRMAALYAKRLKIEITFQRAEVERAEADVEKALNEYVEASREAKVLEKLKEKKYEQYQEYVRKEEDKFIDEITVQRAGFVQR